MGGTKLEISLRPDLPDPAGDGLKRKAMEYFGIPLDDVRTARVLTFESNLGSDISRLLEAELCDPVTEVSSFETVFNPDMYDWFIRVGWRPGVKDNTGDGLSKVFEGAINPVPQGYSSTIYALKGKPTRQQVERIAREILSNDIVQRIEVFHPDDLGHEGVPASIPKVKIQDEPSVWFLPYNQISVEEIGKVSTLRNMNLNPRDIPPIDKFFSEPKIISERRKLGLEGITDLELEYLSQGRSDHCNHNTFQGLFRYRDLEARTTAVIDSLFRKYIKEPTERLAAERPWVKSILWDNSGVAQFNEQNFYVVTAETHNSPSNMEAYGGSITGIVGVYRDPLGTGKGSKLIAGAYGFCVGPRNYDGPLRPRLHPRRLQDGVIEGVKDGGNKSGIPTVCGNYTELPEFMGKSLVFVYGAGLMPTEVAGNPSTEKYINRGDLIIMCGGRVGKDGIHGVTASSGIIDENTPAGHVQIGDPYTQKKMHDFLLEARDEGLIQFSTDNGGGGLSSSVGEAARKANTDGYTGADVWLEKVPLKYQGLNPWEIWVSESQERMTISVNPSDLPRFMSLSSKHDVESSVIGQFTNTEHLTINYNGKVCAHIPSSLLNADFPQWEFNATWVSPKMRGLREPVSYNGGIKDDLYKLLRSPNIASKEWIVRQYDHEVQGGSVIKPLCGIDCDMPTDAVVIRPDLESKVGLVITQSLHPQYSKIDTYHMVAASIDEAVRSALAVGGKLEHLTGIDNFCWPSIEPGKNNPDAEYKAAQLVRANMALADGIMAYGIPLLSGKDSMYCDSNMLNTETGMMERISNPPTMQFTVQSIADDVMDCITPDAKEAGNLIYVIGKTKNELGGSEFYRINGYTGLNVPRTDFNENLEIYKKFIDARKYTASVKAVKEGGIGVNVFMMAGGGNMGAEIDLRKLISDGSLENNAQAMFSNTTGRFLVEVKPEYKDAFETAMGQYTSCIGSFTAKSNIHITGLGGSEIFNESIFEMKEAWKSTHRGRP